MQSKATTVAAYLKELPPDRRAVLEAVRNVIRENIDRTNTQEMMGYGLPGFAIPHRVFPQGYHCDPSRPVPFMWARIVRLAACDTSSRVAAPRRYASYASRVVGAVLMSSS